MYKAVIINHFLMYQFVYVFLFVSLIFIVFAIFKRSKISKLIYLAMFSVFLAMGLSELILTFQNKSISHVSTHPSDDLFFIRNKVINHCREIHFFDKQGKRRKRYTNNKPSENEFILYDIVYSKYANGFRYTKCNINSNENYIFLGCSFTFGNGVNDDQTLPYSFSKLMNFEKNVLNCGLSGRSTNLAISIIESNIIDSFTCKNSQTKYFIYSLIDDHIPRNFRSNAYELLPRDNWLYKNGKFEKVSQPFGTVKNMFARSYIYNKFFDDIINKYNKEYYENYMIKSLKLLQEIAETKYKSKFIIIVWPKFDANSVFVDNLKKTNLDLIVLPEYFNTQEYKIEKDGHPNAKANEELANIIMNYINKKNKN